MPTKSESITNRNVHMSPSEKELSYLHEHLELIMAISSGLIILTAWLFENNLPRSIEVVLYLTAFVIGGYHQGKEGIADTIETKELNVELLMVIAAIGAASIGYWTEGAILIFIFAFAGALETYTMNKSKNEISELMKLQPEEARIIQNGAETFIPVSQLNLEDTILVKASERIPADGLIVKGHTSIDESAITGESIPVNKHTEDEVFAGTVAMDGTISIRITKQANETVFQKIINMVQTAKDEKTPAQLFIEKFEGKYVQVVLISVAIMMFIPYLLLGWTLTESIYRAMILLVVASPCALVASIMPAALSMISTSAKNGILFKGAVHAEMLSGVNAFAFDKTGTLTKGKPEVTDFYILPEYDADEVHEVTGLIESESMHPLAKAITKYTAVILEHRKSGKTLSNVKTISGLGMTAMVDGDAWFIGKKSELETEQTFFKEITDTLTSEGKTIVYITLQNKTIAVYGLKDTIREEAVEAIKALKENGVYTMMLTGDNERTAKAIAEETGIDDYIAECMPETKVAQIKQLIDNHGKTAMIGDGINDAPALATANIGIAMGEGTDAALETADMVLMKNDLTKITHAFQKSKKMNRIIKQNIFFSLAVICVLIISNFTQLIDMPLGVIGHEGSTILVILNGLRLLK